MSQGFTQLSPIRTVQMRWKKLLGSRILQYSLGTAIGTKFTPTCTSIFMIHFQRQRFQKVDKQNQRSGSGTLTTYFSFGLDQKKNWMVSWVVLMSSILTLSSLMKNRTRKSTFLMLQCTLKQVNLSQICFVSLSMDISTFCITLAIPNMGRQL